MAWNASKNRIYFQRAVNLGAQLQEARDEIARMEDIWNAENISASPAYVDTDVGGVTIIKEDLTSFITAVLIDYTDFFENRAVPSLDRVDPLAKLLAAKPA